MLRRFRPLSFAIVLGLTTLVTGAAAVRFAGLYATPILAAFLMAGAAYVVLTPRFVSFLRSLAPRFKAMESGQHELRALTSLQSNGFAVPPMWSQWALPPTSVAAILQRVALADAELIVECGSGVSTLYFARYLQARGKGHVISFEEDAAWHQRVSRLLQDNGLQDRAQVLHFPISRQEILGLQRTWYDVPRPTVESLLGGKSIDVLVVDGPTIQSGTEARLGALPFFFPYLSAEAVIFLDDAVRADETAVKDRWCTNFPLQARYVETEHGMFEFTRRSG